MNKTPVLVAIVLACACGDDDVPTDGGADAAAPDAALDVGRDAGPDAERDAGVDGGPPDGGDVGVDTGPVDTRFSFVVIPDTQNETLSDRNSTRHFDHRVDWIVANTEALDIRFVLQTGDLCNWDTPDHDQYVRASRGLETLDDAGMPYIIAIGNHDTAATCTGGSACPGDVHANLRDTSTFNEFFPTTRFPTLGGVFEEGKVDNGYHEFHAGGLDWIVINLELWAREGAFEWMGMVLDDFPDHNAIVITHSHLTGSGDIRTSNGGYGDNSPRRIFDEVLSQHANVRFVFSGHEGYSGFREDTGTSGNRIYQFLFNQDDATNPTRIVEVDTETNTIDSRVYGPATDMDLTGEGTEVHLTDVDWVR